MRFEELKIVTAPGRSYFEGVLKEALTEKILDEQEEIMEQNARDILAGKYQTKEDLERMPLYRKENPDGSAFLTNVPDTILFWASLMGVLNEDYFHNRKGSAAGAIGPCALPFLWPAVSAV